MEDFDVSPSPILADLFQPHEFDQIVPDMFPTPIIISDDDTEPDDAVPTPFIVISDDETNADDLVPQMPTVAPPSPITIWSTGTTGDTPSYDPAEDQGTSTPTPDVSTPSYGPLPLSPGLPDPTLSPAIDIHYEMGLEGFYDLPMESIGDSHDDPLLYYPDIMIPDEPANYQSMESVGHPDDDPFLYDPDVMMMDQPLPQPADLSFSHTIPASGEPSSFPPMEPSTTYSPLSQPFYDYGEPSSFPTMEVPMTELPFYQTTYQTGGPSSLPAMDASFDLGGSASSGDPYAPQSYHYGQGSNVFGVRAGYVDPHGFPYHTYLGGSDLYPRCFTCGGIGHSTGVCTSYDEPAAIPYLHSAQPAGDSSEWGYCPNCDMLLYIWRS